MKKHNVVVKADDMPKHPVGSHCVRSLYTVLNKQKSIVMATRSVERVMREKYIKEVIERKE